MVIPIGAAFFDTCIHTHIIRFYLCSNLTYVRIFGLHIVVGYWFFHAYNYSYNQDKIVLISQCLRPNAFGISKLPGPIVATYIMQMSISKDISFFILLSTDIILYMIY